MFSPSPPCRVLALLRGEALQELETSGEAEGPRHRKRQSFRSFDGLSQTELTFGLSATHASIKLLIKPCYHSTASRPGKTDIFRIHLPVPRPAHDPIYTIAEILSSILLVFVFEQEENIDKN